MKALIDPKSPKADRLEDQAIPPTPMVVLLESSMQPPHEDLEYEPPLPADSDVEPEQPSEPVFPDLVLTPKGEIIPDGFHWDGHRIVCNKGSSKRPEGIDSKLRQMIGSNERKKIIEEEDAKALAEAQGGKSAPSGIKSKKKKSSVAQREATQSLPATAKLVGDTWEIILPASPKFAVPAMPKVAAPAVEEHRLKLRELVKQKIKELEFKVALDLFASVARLVSKDEIASNPNAQAAFDKEWDNIRNKGVWDEERVRECRDIVAEARREGKNSSLRTDLRSMLRERIRTPRVRSPP